MEFWIVALIGGAVGAVELVGRYRDHPMSALRAPAAILYIVVNVLAAVTALFLLKTLGKDLVSGTGVNKTIMQILIAGFGALAFMRSSIFKWRQGDAEIAIGPAALLDVLLAAADRGVDRTRAKARANTIIDIMKEVSFEKAGTVLPPLCFGLMQNVTQDEQKAISDQVKLIAQDQDIPPTVKSMLLGLILMNIVGEGVLRAAKDSTFEEIKRGTIESSTQNDAQNVRDLLLNEIMGSAARGEKAPAKPVKKSKAKTTRRSRKSTPDTSS